MALFSFSLIGITISAFILIVDVLGIKHRNNLDKTTMLGQFIIAFVIVYIVLIVTSPVFSALLLMHVPFKIAYIIGVIKNNGAAREYSWQKRQSANQIQKKCEKCGHLTYATATSCPKCSGKHFSAS